jgi:hypothetical protein
MDMQRFVFQMTCFVYADSESAAREVAERLSYHHLRTDEEVSRIAEEGDLRVEKVWSAERGCERKEVKRHGVAQ